MKHQLKNQSFFLWFNKIIFPWLYLGHWGKETTLIKVGQDNRLRVRVNTSDILLIWEIWKFKIYRDKQFPIRPGDTVVDIGAHIGVFSIWASQQAREGQVYAFEASSSNHKLLVENKQLNHAENLHIENLAIYNEAGQFSFYQPGKNGALGSLMQDRSAHHEVVTTTTLSNIISDHNIEKIDYLKMDVEGAEFPILFNASSETLNTIRYIVLEYHRFKGMKWQPEDLVEFLEGHGFKVMLDPGIFFQEKLFGTGVIKAWREGTHTTQQPIS